MLNGLKQFLYGSSMTGTEVHGVDCTIGQQMLDRTGVSICKIEDVDKVEDAGPIPRIVVRPQHFKIRLPPESRFNGDRYGVSVGRMTLTNTSMAREFCKLG